MSRFWAGRASGQSEKRWQSRHPEHAGKKDDLCLEDLRETQSGDVKRLPPYPVPDTFHCPPPAGPEPQETLVKISHYKTGELFNQALSHSRCGLQLDRVAVCYNTVATAEEESDSLQRKQDLMVLLAAFINILITDLENKNAPVIKKLHLFQL